MILMIDNYDSFTYNLVQYLGEIGEEIIVRRNDDITIEEIKSLAPDYFGHISGPMHPDAAGISLEVIRQFSGEIPILGVCLGHQAIAQVFGGEVVKAERLVHGKTSAIYHDGQTIFTKLDDPFKGTRYHSLIVRNEGFPACLEVSAWTDADEIMGIRHKEMAVEGVQFHPESIMTESGMQLLRNFIDCYRPEGK